MRNSHLLFVSCLFLCTQQALAQFDPAELRKLIESGKAAEAYRQALERSHELEGDPVFDFYYGLSAVESGHPDEAVLALARANMQEPHKLRTRFELARAYFLLGNYEAARQEFEFVLERDPPQEARATIAGFLKAIDAKSNAHRSKSSGYVQLAIGYDTNINSAPDDPSAALFGTETPWASEHASAYGQVEAGGRYVSPLTSPWMWFASATGSWRSHTDGSSFNNGFATGQVGLAHNAERDRFQVAAIGQDYVIRDRAFRTLQGVSGNWSRSALADRQYGSTVTYAHLDFPEESYRNATLLNIGGDLAQGMGKGIFFAGVSLGSEQADGDSPFADASVDRVFGITRLGFQWPLSNEMIATVTLLLQASQYKEAWSWPEEDYEQLRREDIYGALDIELKRHLADGISVVGNVSGARNDSSVVSYEYERYQARIALRYEQ